MMQPLRYLNTILTILALLLTVQLWTTWAGEPGQSMRFVAEAHAQQGLPNAAAQRKQIVDLLREQNVQLANLTELLESGKARVRVEAAGN
jgi:hypothetical protein